MIQFAKFKTIIICLETAQKEVILSSEKERKSRVGSLNGYSTYKNDSVKLLLFVLNQLSHSCFTYYPIK